MVSNKSFHSGFACSISAIFQARSHFFIAFSRAMPDAAGSHHPVRDDEGVWAPACAGEPAAPKTRRNP
jgi:hypothetical protein